MKPYWVKQWLPLPSVFGHQSAKNFPTVTKIGTDEETHYTSVLPNLRDLYMFNSIDAQ